MIELAVETSDSTSSASFSTSRAKPPPEVNVASPRTGSSARQGCEDREADEQQDRRKARPAEATAGPPSRQSRGPATQFQRQPVAPSRKSRGLNEFLRRSALACGFESWIGRLKALLTPTH